MRRRLAVLGSLAAWSLGCTGTISGGSDSGSTGNRDAGVDAGIGADAGGSGQDAGTGATLSARYPCDQGIASDPAVVWTENFEEGSVPAVTSRYDSATNPPGMTLVADVPARSCGHASMQLTAGGTSSATDLYKELSGHDELYVRHYARYQPGVQWHHTGVWFGGYNPPTPYPNPQAGTKPAGNDRISVSIEPVWGVGAPNPRFDFYNYWMNMHSYSNPPSQYWGNTLVHQNAFTIDEGQWVCIEVHVKLNTDMTSAAGAILEVWKNDVLVQHFDDQTPQGCWIADKFCPVGADGSECTQYWTSFNCNASLVPLDLQWRTTTALQLNYFWPQNYITATSTGSVQYDDMVVATTRIGCLQ